MKIQVNFNGNTYDTTIFGENENHDMVVSSKNSFATDQDAIIWAINRARAKNHSRSIFTIEFDNHSKTFLPKDIQCAREKINLITRNMKFSDIAKTHTEIPQEMVDELIKRTALRVSMEFKNENLLTGDVVDDLLVNSIVMNTVGCTPSEIYENAKNETLDIVADYNDIVLQSFEYALHENKHKKI